MGKLKVLSESLVPNIIITGVVIRKMLETELLNYGVIGAGLLAVAKSYKDKDAKLEKVTVDNQKHTQEVIDTLSEKHEKDVEKKLQHYSDIMKNTADTFANTLDIIRQDSKENNQIFTKTLDNINTSLQDLREGLVSTTLEIKELNTRLEKVEDNTSIIDNKEDRFHGN